MVVGGTGGLPRPPAGVKPLRATSDRGDTSLDEVVKSRRAAGGEQRNTRAGIVGLLAAPPLQLPVICFVVNSESWGGGGGGGGGGSECPCCWTQVAVCVQDCGCQRTEEDATGRLMLTLAVA